MRKLLVMGRIEGAYGIRGWVNVRTFTETVGGLLDYPRWWIGPAEREMEVLEGRVHGSGIVAQLAGVADREQAQALRGSEVAIPRDWLPAPAEGEVYWADLVGLEVQNEEGEILGKVKQVFSNGGHDVLEVIAEVQGSAGGVRLIPYVAEYFCEVDLAAGRIRVRWPSDW